MPLSLMKPRMESVSIGDLYGLLNKMYTLTKIVSLKLLIFLSFFSSIVVVAISAYQMVLNI